jgi:CysZ protein
MFWLGARLVVWLVPDMLTLPWIGPVGGIDTALGWAVLPVMLAASVFLMVPVASAFCGLFLDNVAQAVEDRHYPALPQAQPVPLGTQVIDSVNFFGVIVAANAVALVLYVVSGPLAPVVFWAVNGYLLGREYFTLAAMRHVGRDGARALRRRHSGTIWLAGTLMAAPLSLPLVNLLIPVLGAATFTHLFHRLQAQAPAPR